MQSIEIRHNKKTLIPMLALLFGSLIVVSYFVFFTDRYDGNNLAKVISIFLSVMLIYGMYFPVRKLLNNEPVLTISRTEITINEKGKPVSFLWMQIRGWKIENDNGNNSTNYLIIETADEKKKINISWLEMNPDEIEELITEYKNGN
jgi:hypothetical protein